MLWSMSLHTWHHHGPHKQSSNALFMLHSHWGRAATGKKSCICVHRVASVKSDSLRPCRLWPTRFLYQGGGFSRQEYWSILANTGCHTLLLLLLLSRFSRVRLCATPPTLGFSRQEHWSGLPFLLQCMKVKSESEVAQSCSTLNDPMDCSL